MVSPELTPGTNRAGQKTREVGMVAPELQLADGLVPQDVKGYGG